MIVARAEKKNQLKNTIRKIRQVTPQPGNRPVFMNSKFYAQASSDTWYLFIIRIAVFIAAGIICLVLIKTLPLLAAKWSVTVFGSHASNVPSWILAVLNILYAFFIITVCFPFIVTVGWMGLANLRKDYSPSVPFVSIVIPAFNEEQPILRSLEALRQLEYPLFEVIVVNDGSTDFTFSAIERSRVKCIHLKQNQGKAAALNAGIAAAKGAIIVFSDSDSWLHPMALRHLVQGFSSPDVGAVAGTVEIEHSTNLLRRWQIIEYTFAQFFVKKAQLGSSRSVAICPGPVCAFRKDLLLKIGGFTKRTITEDFDSTLKIIKTGYRVEYSPKAIAYTDAPATWQELKRQRLRWFRGHIQTFRLHKDLLFSPKFGALGLYWLPVYYLFFGYICGALEFILLPIVICLVFASGNSLAMLQATSFYVIFVHLFVSIGYSLVLFHSRRFTPLLFFAVCLVYPYLFYLNWLRLLAITNETRGKIATWSG